MIIRTDKNTGSAVAELEVNEPFGHNENNHVSKYTEHENHLRDKFTQNADHITVMSETFINKMIQLLRKSMYNKSHRNAADPVFTNFISRQHMLCHIISGILRHTYARK